MTLVLTQRVSPVSGAALRAVVQRLADRLPRLRVPTPQQRAERYVSLMPIAVLAAL